MHDVSVCNDTLWRQTKIRCPFYSNWQGGTNWFQLQKSLRNHLKSMKSPEISEIIGNQWNHLKSLEIMKSRNQKSVCSPLHMRENLCSHFLLDATELRVGTLYLPMSSKSLKSWWLIAIYRTDNRVLKRDKSRNFFFVSFDDFMHVNWLFTVLFRVC
jgi:hypothetical protein